MEAEKYEAVIGIEIHAQIDTASKMFCTCSTEAFEVEPNIHTCPICMGFPGQLPVINKEAVKKGLVAALALNCKIPSFSKFDRKNYFYPDLPKGFQISQYDEPLALDGWLEVTVDGKKKKIGITRLHLEDDAGKLTHIQNGTLCDYNRTGIPLMEIVSEPDIRSPSEAGAYAKAMQTILRYVGASEADMEKGMMRFDASVSIRPKGDKKLYARAEIKNLNSFRALESAVSYEIERQKFLWEEGKPQDRDITVGWTDDQQKTYFLREKEGADDYRYFPEPDLPPVIVEVDTVEELKRNMPELYVEKKERYINELKLSDADAEIIASDRGLADFFESITEKTGDYKSATSFVVTILLSYLKKNGISVAESKVTAENLADLLLMVKEGKISLNQAKGEVFEDMFDSGKSAAEIVKERGLEQVSDENKITNYCEEVVSENSKVVEDFKGGKKQAIGFLVGQVMKKSNGMANPKLVNQIINKIINS